MNTLYYISRVARHPQIVTQVNLLECFKSVVRRKTSEGEFLEKLTGRGVWGGFAPAFNESDPDDKYHLSRHKRLIYYLVKNMRPGIVVETGVCAGHCSGYILQAMKENGKGALYSIDKVSTFKAEYHDLPRGKAIGYVVPESLRGRWWLDLNGSENALPRLLNTLPDLDLFIHDSLHTYEMMMFEYSLAWGKLRRGGILLSHDVWKPFVQFARLVNRTPEYCDVYGAIVK